MWNASFKFWVTNVRSRRVQVQQMSTRIVCTLWWDHSWRSSSMFKKSLLSGREIYWGWEESSLDQILLSIQSHQVNISHPTDSSQDIKREKRPQSCWNEYYFEGCNCKCWVFKITEKFRFLGTNFLRQT